MQGKAKRVLTPDKGETSAEDTEGNQGKKPKRREWEDERPEPRLGCLGVL
jgi:hypothetical protein